MRLIASVLLFALRPILYPLCNFFIFHGIRYREGTIQVAADVYEHPQTDRRIVLVGMLHEAQGSFYQAIATQIRILQKERYAFVSEGILRLSKTKQKKGGSQMNSSLNAFMAHICSPSETALLLDLELQATALADLPRKSIDISCLDIYQMLKKQKAWPKNFPLANAKTLYPLVTPLLRTFNKQRFIRKSVRNYLGQTILAELHRKIFGLDRGWNEVIVAHRDRHAAQEILELAKFQHVVSDWGAAHLRGIGNHLASAGFVRVSRNWNVALDQQTLRLNPAFQKYLDDRESAIFLKVMEPVFISAMMRQK